MDAEKLQSEIVRIAGMVEIEREPAITALWRACKTGGYSQQKPLLRGLVKVQANAPREADRVAGVDRLKAEFFMLNVKGKVRIGHFTSEQVNGHSRQVLNLMTVRDFETWHSNSYEAESWLNDPTVRKYTGLITDPTKPEEWNGKLNLWNGFGVPATSGDGGLFVSFVHAILASGNQQWCDYILDWLAWIVQRPGERVGVVLCLVSAKEGTGKGTLGNLLLTLFGQHGRSISDSEGLTGHFNAHLADCLYCFADEALFAGDLRGADRFKNKVTEPWMAVTPKGVDSIEVENRLSILMATNHRFAATVGFSDRRFAMFEVSDVPQSRYYWDGLHNWLNGGGKNIVLDLLQRRELSGFHPVDSRPITPIYLDQRRQSLRDSHLWWSEVLEAESFGTDKNGFPLVAVQQDYVIGSCGLPVPSPIGSINKNELYRAYRAWHERTQKQVARPVTREWFWKDFYTMTQSAVGRGRPGKRGEQQRCINFPFSEGNVDWMRLQEAFELWLSSS